MVVASLNVRTLDADIRQTSDHPLVDGNIYIAEAMILLYKDITYSIYLQYMDINI